MNPSQKTSYLQIALILGALAAGGDRDADRARADAVGGLRAPSGHDSDDRCVQECQREEDRTTRRATYRESTSTSTGWPCWAAFRNRLVQPK